MRLLHETAARGEFATGVLYVEPDKEDFVSLLGIVDEPLAALPLERVRPGRGVLDEVMELADSGGERTAMRSRLVGLRLCARARLWWRWRPARTRSRKRPLTVDDLYNLRDVRDPQRSPDGKWVAYTVTRAIRETDKNDTDVWMVSWDGRGQVQLTSTPDSESRAALEPRRQVPLVSLVAAGREGRPVWLLNRAGGEAVKLTDVKGGVTDYAWSPDSRAWCSSWTSPIRAIRQTIERQRSPEKPKTPKPIVIDRYHFKSDVDGYLRGERTHLYLFDVATKKAEVLTPGHVRRGGAGVVARRHPDRVRRASAATGDVDKAPNRDLFVIDAQGRARSRRG